MRQTLTINSLQAAEEFVETMLPLFADHQVFAFHGDLGAGKTTYIKMLCAALGVEDDMSSPSFALVNEYRAAGKRICHFDLYRLKRSEELLDIGWEDYLLTSDLIFIEWPERGEEYIPDDALHVFIKQAAQGEARNVTITDQPLTHV